MRNNYFNQFSTYKETKEENNKVWVYTRVSSKEQFENNNSIGNQESAADVYAKKNGFNIVKTFGGTYESGKDDITRKEFLRLMSEVKKSKDKPHAILIYKMSRYSRSGGSAVGLVTELTDALGVHLIEVSTGKDTTTPRGMHEVLESLLDARKENIERLEITIPGMKRFVEQGNWFGVAPKGYSHYGPRVKNPKFIAAEQRIEINEEGELLKQAWNWKLKGDPDYLIIDRLNNLGLKMSKQAVSGMWRKPFYCGINTSSFLEGKAIKGHWKPIVSEKNFMIINERLKDNGNNGYQQSKKHEDRPLQGILTCDSCGSKITGYKAKKRYDYYKCQNKKCDSKDMNALDSRNQKGLNSLFAESLKEFKVRDEVKPLLMKQMALTIKRIEGDNASNHSRLIMNKDALTTKLKKLERNNALGDVPSDIYHEIKGEIMQDLYRLEEQIEYSQIEISNLNKKIEECVELTQNVSNIWSSSDYDNKVKLQKLMFPNGLSISPKNRQYRTNKVNLVFSSILDFKGDTEGQKKDASKKNLDASCLVAGIGLEPMTFGL